MFEKWHEKIKARREKITEARDKFSSFLEISQSKGWKIYEDKIDRKIEIIRERLSNDLSLSSEDLKRLQLALQVWKEVKRIPKELEDNAKGGK